MSKGPEFHVLPPQFTPQSKPSRHGGAVTRSVFDVAGGRACIHSDALKGSRRHAATGAARLDLKRTTLQSDAEIQHRPHVSVNELVGIWVLERDE
jgi:hypothetical protein